MEYWSDVFSETHYSITPLLHHSRCFLAASFTNFRQLPAVQRPRILYPGVALKIVFIVD